MPATLHTRGVQSHVANEGQRLFSARRQVCEALWKMVVASLRDALWRVVAAITTLCLTACMVLIALRASRLSEAAGKAISCWLLALMSTLNF